MTNLGNNILKAVYRNGTLHFVANDADPVNKNTGIRLVRLFVLPFPNLTTVGEPSYINVRFGKRDPSDAVNALVWYGWPAIEVNKKGDMAIVYARSGTTVFPEVGYSTFFDTETSIRLGRTLQLGFGPIGSGCLLLPGAPCVSRWGDTAGASADPDDDGIWIAQQYANALGRWNMWVGKIFGK